VERVTSYTALITLSERGHKYLTKWKILRNFSQAVPFLFSPQPKFCMHLSSMFYMSHVPLTQPC